jgi:aerobic-type carbon monoxide dehydrogenase small subunit (CoxS/CutS family)
MPEKDRVGRVSRRQFLRGLGVVGAGSTLVTDLLLPQEQAPLAEAEPAPLQEAPVGKTLKRGMQPITLTVNNTEVAMQVEPRTTLLNALRNHADPPITGPKLVCDQGACGACTVLVDGRSAYGCMLLAADVIGKKITTVEGLVGGDGQLNPVQEAFVERDAMMCGFCTPGFVMSVHGLLQNTPDPTLEQVKQACAGNVCRCGAYPRVFEAALAASKKMQGRA